MLGYLNEYCFSIITPTLSYGISPTFAHVSRLDNGGFGSLYLVTKEVSKAIIEAGTTAKYQGVVWSQRLWLDIDSLEAAEKVEQKLIDMGLNYVAYFTGNRGAHFGILRLSPPSHLLPLQDREWVRAHFPEADDSIYTHLHLFRLPGTLHSKTGKPKVLVNKAQGKAISYEPYRNISSHINSRPSRPFAESQGQSVFETIRIMGNSVPTNNGSRHPTLVKLTYALRDKGVDVNIARWWIGEVNKMCEELKSDNELDHIIKTIYG